MRPICLARLEKTRPVVVLTRPAALQALGRVTVAPVTSTVWGLASEVPVGRSNGLDHEGVISLDNVTTILKQDIGRTIGFLSQEQEWQLANAILLAYDLDLAPHIGPL